MLQPPSIRPSQYLVRQFVLHWLQGPELHRHLGSVSQAKVWDQQRGRSQGEGFILPAAALSFECSSNIHFYSSVE